MTDTITIHYKYRSGALFDSNASRTCPVLSCGDEETVLALIDSAERIHGKPIIVQSVKKHTVIETDLTGILRE